jgi:Arc/MetJ family transcription regulator
VGRKSPAKSHPGFDRVNETKRQPLTTILRETRLATAAGQESGLDSRVLAAIDAVARAVPHGEPNPASLLGPANPALGVPKGSPTDARLARPSVHGMALASMHGHPPRYTSLTRDVYDTCMAKVRTNIELEDDYVRAIMDRYGVHTKTEAVDLALRHLAGQPMTREQALAMRGTHAIDDVPVDASPRGAA